MIKLFKVVETSSRPLALQGMAKTKVVPLYKYPLEDIYPATEDVPPKLPPGSAYINLYPPEIILFSS